MLNTLGKNHLVGSHRHERLFSIVEYNKDVRPKRNVARTMISDLCLLWHHSHHCSYSSKVCFVSFFSFYLQRKKTLSKNLSPVMRNEVCKPLYSEIQMYQTVK